MEDWTLSCEKYHDVFAFLNTLAGSKLCYGIKSPDMDLYDFGFCQPSCNQITLQSAQDDCSFVLHCTCRFKVIWQHESNRTVTYREDTPAEVFHADIQALLGMSVICVTLSETNDLWLDFGDCLLMFATHESNDEAWRLFIPGRLDSHLVASYYGVDFPG